LSNKLQNYLSIFSKKVKMENSKRTMVAREKRAITNYYIIKPYLQQINVSNFTQLWRNSILHCENENLIKADWLTKVW
jgi:hypothetical protein